MTETTRHTRAKELFFEAAALPADRREAFLEQACTDDAALKGEVLSLLAFQAAEPPATKTKRERFATGEIYAKRYRIVALAGAGGMGEVYRAHDLLLDEPVALKFVRPAGRMRPDAILEEVRLARRITHPGICRVFDAGQEGDETFISMEWVDGEDLRSLVDRIGRLSPDKALDIARQAAAALAAAHAQGVLHRDLKPANLLMDRQGRIKLTDFGIATRTGARNPDELLAGTPAYMAPELFAGLPASERSDLYSLGLILHELLTGERAIGAASDSEIVDRQTHSRPGMLAGRIPGVEAKFDSAIARALEKDPELRQRSVLAFAASLPGADPLALAADAGVTPSPELVAAAGAGVRGSKRLAAALGASILLATAGIMALADRTSRRRETDLRATPGYLAGRSMEMLGKLGWRTPPADDDWGYFPNFSATAPGDSIRFWYRAAPAPLVNDSFIFPGIVNPAVDMKPVPGMVTIFLDPAGHLDSLESVPEESGAPEGTSLGGTANWDALLAAAGLDPARLEAAEPDRRPARDAEAVKAWRLPAADGAPELRIRAASIGDRIVWFTKEYEQPATATLAANWWKIYQYQYTVMMLFRFVLPLLALPLAWLQIRNGRADARGSWTLFRTIAFATLAASLLGNHHVAELAGEIELLESTLASALYGAARLVLVYLALEPWTRRIWPQTLIAWSRLMQGRVIDPTVGRSLAIGTLAGLAWAMLRVTADLVRRMEIPGTPLQPLDFTTLDNAMRARQMFVLALETFSSATYRGLLYLLVAVLFRWLFKRPLPALVAYVLLLTALEASRSGPAPFTWLLLGLSVAGSAWLLIRVGLLAMVAAHFAALVAVRYPIGFDWGGWWSASGLFGVALILCAGLAGVWLLFRAPGRTQPPGRAETLP